jgi:hypothetical protein
MIDLGLGFFEDDDEEEDPDIQADPVNEMELMVLALHPTAEGVPV